MGESLQWRLMGEQPGQVFTSEPEVTPLTQWRNMLLAPFVPERLL